ncbi:MAG: hypothetical protein J6386_24790 [Candidatus Synoicihabitans palmerolidicus]|nr:hypothetical protein [Candidatus Synoicihabitans palmerolidicus]
MCRNQEILPGSAALFLRYFLFYNLLRLWDTLYVTGRRGRQLLRRYCFRWVASGGDQCPRWLDSSRLKVGARANSMNWLGCHSSRRNGPLPTKFSNRV